MADDNDSDVGDLLDNLLGNDDDDSEPEENVKSTPKKILKELDFNFLDKVDKTEENSEKNSDKNGSMLKSGWDSSDDEDNKYFEEQKYSESGRSIKELLKKQEFDKQSLYSSKLEQKPILKSHNDSMTSDDIAKKVKNNTFLPSPPKNADRTQNAKKTGPLTEWLNKPSDVYSDPIFGLRIVKPLVSSAELKERMKDRKTVTVSRIKHFIATQDLSNDWVIAGVLIQKSTTKKSQNGNAYCIWTISDLSDAINTVSIFLFKEAYKLFWKTDSGVVIAILNPNVLESRSEKDQATLSVDKAQKIMILGNSKDLGRCKSKKKSGEACNNIVNISRCEYCLYHVKHEYNKASRRPDLGTDPMNRKFRNILSNSKPNTSGSGMYSQANHHNNMLLIPAKRNVKMEQKDSARLALLMGKTAEANDPPKNTHVESNGALKNKINLEESTNSQVKKDLDRLSKIRGSTFGAVSANLSGKEKLFSPSLKSKSTTTEKKSTSFSLSNLPPIPKLGMGVKGNIIDFSEPITKKHINSAKANAIKWVKENGGIKQSNPNKIGQSREKKDAIREVNKRRREEEEEEVKVEPKTKINKISDEFKKLMEASSAHEDLIEKSKESDKEKYFKKLEAKERMEEKMINTFKVDCKAVTCLVCRYTSFSASEMCKEKKHPLRVIDAVKSFFKCSDCGNRTVSLDRLPSTSCKKCSSSNWVRTGMMDEKKMKLPGPVLSIRGGEEKFIGSDIKDANLDLLVPITSES
ncbi:protein MCM10 homolog [Chelonus insularis]|uniref:protein MCM10 homolog n=1 Tax=Chelonus insularis TaxID=460826 RepID=UPI00158A0523|nr:protein MCM10 homolog [Chelonus insularis]